MDNSIMSTRDVLRHLGIARPALSSLMRNGKLTPSGKFGNQYMWLRREVECYADDRALFKADRAEYYRQHKQKQNATKGRR